MQLPPNQRVQPTPTAAACRYRADPYTFGSIIIEELRMGGGHLGFRMNQIPFQHTGLSFLPMA